MEGKCMLSLDKQCLLSQVLKNSQMLPWTYGKAMSVICGCSENALDVKTELGLGVEKRKTSLQNVSSVKIPGMLELRGLNSLGLSSLENGRLRRDLIAFENAFGLICFNV